MDTEGDDGGLTSKQVAAIAGLLAEPTIERAAKSAGCDPKSIYVWLREDAAFIREYRTAQRGVVGQAVTLLMRLTTKSVKVMAQTLDSENEALAHRAAVDVFDRSLNAVELLDLSERVEALEAAAAKRSKRRR